MPRGIPSHGGTRLSQKFTADDPRAAANGRKQAAAYSAKFRHVPAKKQPPAAPGVSWWIGTTRAQFAAEVEAREKARQAHAAAVSYQRPMDY